MSFYEKIDHYRDFDIAAFCNAVTPRKIESILERDRLTELDYLALLSDAALPFLEQAARKANELTKRHFGNVIFIFTPLYISNLCDNVCSYCSFGRHHAIRRRHMTIDEIRNESKIISESGIRHILVLTGESRGKATPAYCEEAAGAMREYFSSIAFEIYPLSENEYGGLVASGADGLTIFQETYHEARYHELHCGGPKDNYLFRLEAPERACRGGMRTMGIGALLGLDDPIRDGFFMGLHADYLQRHFPAVEVSLSFPRLRPLVADFVSRYSVDERRLAQMIVAARLFLPSAGITLSTRENARFRDAAAGFGVTRMSAGVSTAVAGRSTPESTPQFEIADRRSVDEMNADLSRLGYQTVMHDWNGRLVR